MTDTPLRFRKKPVVIEAMCFEGTAEKATPIIDWVLAGDGTARWHEAVEAGLRFGWPEHIAIDTLEGTMRADVGDWIIRGVKGEHYPCKPEIFEATYEPAEHPDA